MDFFELDVPSNPFFPTFSRQHHWGHPFHGNCEFCSSPWSRPHGGWPAIARGHTWTSDEPSRRPRPWVQSVNAAGFDPDDIEVRTVDNNVKIHALREVGDEEHGLSRHEFTRNVKLPDDVDPSTLRTMMSNDGHMKLVAQRRVVDVDIEDKRNEKLMNAETAVPVDSTSASTTTSVAVPKGSLAQLQLPGFRPADLKVSVVGNSVYVRAEQDTEEDDISISRSIYRVFPLPDGVNPADVRSRFTEDGKLVVSAGGKDFKEHTTKTTTTVKQTPGDDATAEENME